MKNQETEIHANLLRFIKTKVDSIDDAEDILASVLLSYVSNKDSVENPSAWLYTACKNRISDFYRTRKSSESFDEHLHDQTSYDSFDFSELKKCIKPTIERFEDKYETAITLVDLEGLSLKDAAQKSQITTAALKSRLFKARQLLKQKLTQCCPPKKNSNNSIYEFSDNPEHCKNTC